MHETGNPPQPTQGPIAPGRVLGARYTLQHRIAAGGMAEVWQATDGVLQRQVAVKVLYPHLAADQTFLARFRSEALAAARLHHPGIVAVFDTVSEPATGVEAIVMELVRGKTLREHLDSRGVLDPAEAIDIAVEVADALGAAHAAGMVHRDVKPANILLTDDGRVMVTDFGIAKLADQPDHTQTGTMIGSVKYLAPEQVEGARVDGRADLFALGVVLYEALGGRAPWVADTQTATAVARLHQGPIPLHDLRPEVPPALEQVVLRSLARAPDDRYATADAMRRALVAARSSGAARRPTPVPRPELDHTPVHTPAPARAESPPRRRRRSAVAYVTLLLILAAVTVVGILLYRTTAGEDALTKVADETGIDLPGAREAGPLPIAAVGSFDPPPGDGAEGDDGAAAATDGDDATAWRTEMYDSRAFGNLKDGVGIWVRLEDESVIRTVRLTSPTSDWGVELYVADRQGATLADWGEPIATRAGAGDEVELDAGGAAGSFVLVWITDLGDGPPRVFTEIAEIEVLGR